MNSNNSHKESSSWRERSSQSQFNRCVLQYCFDDMNNHKSLPNIAKAEFIFKTSIIIRKLFFDFDTSLNEVEPKIENFQGFTDRQERLSGLRTYFSVRGSLASRGDLTYDFTIKIRVMIKSSKSILCAVFVFLGIVITIFTTIYTLCFGGTLDSNFQLPSRTHRILRPKKSPRLRTSWFIISANKFVEKSQTNWVCFTLVCDNNWNFSIYLWNSATSRFWKDDL